MPHSRRPQSQQARRRDDGAAAVEFALVSIPLLLLMFGILQYGYFFFQLTAVEYALDTASRQVELGDVEACDTLGQLVRDQPGIGDAATVSWTPADPLANVQRADLVRVSITWEPVRIGGGLIPFPAGERVTARDVVVDHLGAGDIWTTPSIGCPAS